jgi:ribosomal protein S18 acetylase RimI-like enzyme
MTTIRTNKYIIEYEIEDDIIILHNLEVFEEYRGKGWGEKAMQRFMNKFSGRKIELHAYAQDDTTDTNRLVEFYEKFNFEVVTGCEEYGYEMKY